MVDPIQSFLDFMQHPFPVLGLHTQFYITPSHPIFSAFNGCDSFSGFVFDSFDYLQDNWSHILLNAPCEKEGKNCQFLLWSMELHTDLRMEDQSGKVLF